MADTTKSIKNATDKELREILDRLRREREALRMLSELQTKSAPNPNGAFPKYGPLGPFSTETIVSNNKSIKQMTDAELFGFVTRLQSENELVNIIGEIARFNSPPEIDSYGNYMTDMKYEGVDLNTPVKDLYHFGIPGMHWGRKGGSKSTAKGSQDYIESQSLKKKGIKNLSTAELKTLTTRKQLETSYKTLNPNVIKKGKNAGKAVLAGMAAVTTVAVFANSPAGKSIISTAKTAVKTFGKTKWVL